MKNLTKPILILIFSYSLFSSAVFGQRNITVFNTPINLFAPIVKGEFATGYPASIGASHVRDCLANGLKSTNLLEIYHAVVNSVTEPLPPNGNPVLGAFFTTEYDGDTLSVIKDKTHGFCFGFHSDSILTLYYYEANAFGKYDRVENLTTRINSINENLFLALHYSHFSPGFFPDKSTVFRFVCDSIGSLGNAEPLELEMELSRDYKRQSGLFPLGMADSLIITGSAGPNTGESNCGGPCLTTVANSSCAIVANSYGFVVYTCQTNMGHCAAGSIERKAKEGNIVLGVPIKYKTMREFRDQFMIKYCEGRKYTGFYYAFSKYAKMSISMLWKYASILPDLYTAMENLSDENSNKIIVTPSLKAKVLEILNDHADVGDAYFQSILKEVAEDMEAYEGIKKNDLISLLTPYGNCTGERKSITERGTEQSYFVSVFDNTGKDEIIANYSVPGSRIKFELYNSTAGLVTSVINSSSKQKLNISTSSLAPGVYIYRISSDSGYENIGKVAVIK
ncbi:MAG: hypothetical protein ABI763_06035 [Bacteroidota bacterium]